MTTVEKLLVQIFERKNSIIEQVNQQTDLYSQHLASKLIIDGIKPPSWLWSPSASPDSNELNKEELISKLLRPYPRPPAKCSVPHHPLYETLVVTGDHEDLSGGVFMENPDCGKGFNKLDHSTTPPMSSEEQAGCALDGVPEPDVSFTSPMDQIDERIVNIYNAPDHSLAGIQRSKSRQKALELRNSSKALDKSGISNENIRNALSGKSRFSLSSTNKVFQNDEPSNFSEYWVTGSQNRADSNLYNADVRSKVQEKNEYSGRITRSRSNAKVPDFVQSYLGCSSEILKNDTFRHISEVRRTQSMDISDSGKAADQVYKEANSAGPSFAYYQSCGDKKVDGVGCISNEKIANASAGRISRSSISRKCQSHGSESSKVDISSDDYHRIAIVRMDSGNDSPPQAVDGSPFNPSNVLNEGCSSEIFKDDAFPLISKSRKAQSMHLSDSGEAHECINKDPKLASLSTVSRQSCGDKKVDGADCPTNDEGANIYTARLSGSTVSRKCQSCSDSSEAEISSDDFQRIDTVMIVSEDNSAPRSVNGLLLNPSKVLNEGCSSENFEEDALRLISDVRKTKSMHLSDSGDAHDCVDEEPKSAGPFTVYHQRCGDKKVEGADCLINDEGPNISTAKLSRSCVSSKCRSHGISSKADVSRSDSSKADISSDDYHIIDMVMMDSVDNSPPRAVHGSLSNHSNALAKGCDNRESIAGDFQSHRARSAVPSYGSDQQNAFDIEASDPAIRSQSAKADGGILVPLSDKSVQGVIDAKEKDWSGERKATNQLVSTVIGMEDLKVSGDKNQLVSAPGSGNLRSSKDKKSQLVSSTPEGQNFRVSHAYISAEEPRAESCDFMIDNVDTLNQICSVLETTKQFPAQESQISSCLEGGLCGRDRDSPLRNNVLLTYGTVSPCGENLSPERRFRHFSVETWPQLKRRKLEHKETHNLTTSTFKLRKPHSTKSGSIYFLNIDTYLDTAADAFHADRHTDNEIPPEMVSNLAAGIESAFSSHNGEVGFCYKKEREHNNSSSFVNNELLGAPLVSSVRKESINAQGCFTEDTSHINSSNNHFDVREIRGEQLSQHLCNLEKNSDDLGLENPSLTNTMLEGIQSPKEGSGEQAQASVLSPRTVDLDLIDVDQSMPVLEGFIVDGQADSGGLDLVPDKVDFDMLKLPSNTIERASILAHICRSSSLDKPSSHLSFAFEFQGNQNLYQPERYENLDLASSLSSDASEQRQSRKSRVGDWMEALEVMPYSDYLPYSDTCYGRSLRGQQASPVGKLWERLSSHTGSSEKRSSSNPELTCFPIEEDFSISEENKSMDETAFGVQEVDSSLDEFRDYRQPLKDLSNLGLNPPMSVSVHEKALVADRMDSLGTKLSVTGTQDKAQYGRKIQHLNRSDTSEKGTSSIGANDDRKKQPSLQCTEKIKKSKAPFSDSIRKPLVSTKSDLKRQHEKLSLREPKRNNIISNVSSFIPLVQQKQAAKECDGEKDVKVKALEAAKAAKRLEEKKENERKRRKEALQLKRAKLEEKNIRHMDLEKKKKEEKRKKKDAVIIAKKRQREEEEKKEKEKKKMRHEARYQQRGQEKMTAGKAEKDNQSSKDEKMNGKKESLHEFKKQQNREIARGDDVALRKADAKSTTSEVVTTYEDCGVGKVMHALDKSPKNVELIVHNGQGKSYDISPYQCSDDEDEDYDELPTKKSIPSWASKSAVALLLPLQQQKDPDTIFPAESFCTMDEVLLPRKLQQKQVDA
ncbi:exocyst complex component SEC3 [Striga asiatica]|uniref:Exocyst complex component SEC3 n=1 Tax=Striga asiatica TaxID=4170 RepID=A0A5A7PKJ8_STRAF|nr:exocyst complex component SEC3 [Striga asiatica]